MDTGNNNTETIVGKWMKALIPVFVTIIITLGTALWYQSSNVTALEIVVEHRGALIADLKKEDDRVKKEVQELREGISELRGEIKMVNNTQDKVIDVVDRLSTTLGRLEVAMGKLETKLEFDDE